MSPPGSGKVISKIIGPARRRDRTKIGELFADERSRRSLISRNNGRQKDGRPTGGEVQGASEWKNRERNKHLAALRRRRNSRLSFIFLSFISYFLFFLTHFRRGFNLMALGLPILHHCHDQQWSNITKMMKLKK